MPWKDLPYRSPVDPDPEAHPAGTPPWCTARELRLRKGGVPDGAGGAMDFAWQVSATEPCSLQGTPVVRLEALDASWSVTSVQPDTFVLTPGAVVDARHLGVLDLRWGHDVGGYPPDVPPSPFRVTFELPHQGGALSTIAPSSGWKVPGSTGRKAPGGLGRVVPMPLGGSGPPVYGGVFAHPDSATIVATKPIPVTVGHPLSFTVWLRPGTTPISGTPCFGYRERLLDWQTGAVLATEEHELDCTDLRHLPPAGLLLAMTLPLPADISAGEPIEVDWQADTGAEDSAQLAVRARS